MKITYKVEMVNGTGTTVGFTAVEATSPGQAMTLAEEKHPQFAAYDAAPLAPFDYSVIGGMFGASSK